MRNFVIFTSLLIVSGAATAGKVNVSFQPAENQSIRMVDGIPALDSEISDTGVRIIAPEEPIKKRGIFQMVVFNKGGSPFNFGSENVTAKLDDGTSVPIITAEQLAKEEKRRQTWAAIATGLAAASNSMNAATAGWSRGTASYSSYTSSSFGSATTHGFGSYSSYNGGQAAMAQSFANMQNQQMFDRLSVNNAAGKQALKAYLRTTTIDAGDLKGGLVTLELPPQVRRSKAPVSVTFLVQAGQQTHTVKTTFTPTR